MPGRLRCTRRDPRRGRLRHPQPDYRRKGPKRSQENRRDDRSGPSHLLLLSEAHRSTESISFRQRTRALLSQRQVGAVENWRNQFFPRNQSHLTDSVGRECCPFIPALTIRPHDCTMFPTAEMVAAAEAPYGHAKQRMPQASDWPDLYQHMSAPSKDVTDGAP
jgi:hypothetical protein